MKITHTSSTRELSGPNDTFGDFLFFATDPYSMTAEPGYLFEVDVDDSEILSAGSIWFDDDSHKLKDLVSDVMDRLNVDQDTAESLIDETASSGALQEIDGEDSWWLQSITAEAAHRLGYLGVSARDEQGTVYILHAPSVIPRMIAGSTTKTS